MKEQDRKRNVQGLDKIIPYLIIALLLVTAVAAGTVTWDYPPPPGESFKTGVNFSCFQNSTCYYDFNATSTNATALLNYTIDTPPFSQNINIATGVLNFTPTDADVGVYDLFAICKEIFDTGAAFMRITWTINNTNDPPYVTDYHPTTLVNITIPENSTFYLNVTANDPDLDSGDYLNYTWLEDWNPLINVLNSTTYEVNYTPDFLTAGVRVIAVNVTDSENLSVYVNWTINVTDVNRLCVQNDTIQNITMQEDTQLINNLSLQDYFVDPDIDNYPLNFSVRNNPNINISINISGDNNVSIIPYPDFFGTNTIEYRCYDGTNYSNWSNSVLINVTNVPDAPDVGQESDQAYYVGTPIALLINATDVDGDDLYFYDNTTLFDISNPGGWINFTPSTGDIGNYSVNITASDYLSDVVHNTSMIFNITIKNNSQPVLAPIGNRSVTEAESLSIVVNATDEDFPESLVFSSHCNNCSYPPPTSGLFDFDSQTGDPTNATGTISFTTGNNDVGSWSVTIYVNDTRGAYDSETIIVNVTNIDFNPYWFDTTNRTIRVNVSYYTELYAYDQDGDITTFTDNQTTLLNITKSIPFDPMNSTAIINFTPNETGNFSTLLRVFDSTGGSDDLVLDFEVTPNRPPELTNVQNLTTTEDNSTVFTVTATDPDPQDQPDLIFTDNTTLFDINPNTGVISFTPNASQIGNYSIEINASDGELNDTGVFNLTILFFDDLPLWDPPLDEYYVNESGHLESVWNSTLFDGIPTNRTVWNSSIWQDNVTMIYMDGYDEELNDLEFNVSFIEFTNVSNDTVTSGFLEPFNITKYDNNTGLVSFTPNNSHVGRYTVNFTVIDNSSQETGIVLDLTIHNVNDAPIVINFSPEINQSMTENETREFNITASDIDFEDSISYRWYYEDTLISGATGSSYDFYADFDTAGNRTLTVEILDESGLGTNNTWNLNISNLNRPGYYGKLIQKVYSDFETGTLTNMTLTQLNREQAELSLEDLGSQYRPTGTYESEPLNTKESNYYHNFTNITWIGNTTPPFNATYNISFQVRTDQALNGVCPTTLTGDYSSPAVYSGAAIHETNHQCIQYKIFLQTNETQYSPEIDEVVINYVIANHTQEQATSNFWIKLKDYFTDPDSDDNLEYNITDENDLPISPSIANFTINNETTRVTVTTNNNYFGDVLVKFHMTDGEYNISSNVIKLTIEEVPPIQNPIIIPVGGGGGGAVAQPIEVEVDKYVATPLAFRLIAPMKVETYGNDTMKIPINLLNQGNFTIQDIELEAESENEYVDLMLSQSKLAILEPGKNAFLKLTAKSYRTYGDYEILLTAKATAVTVTSTGEEIRTDFTEKTKIFVSSLLRAEGNDTAVQTKLEFARDLLTSNPECLELNEFIEKASKLIQEGKEEEATVMLNRVVESCRFLIAPKEKLPEPEEPKAIGMPVQSIYVLLTVTVLTLIIAIALVFGWSTMKAKGKAYMRPGTK